MTERDRTRETVDSTDKKTRAQAPGRTNTSAALHGPASPIPSGIVQRKQRDVHEMAAGGESGAATPLPFGEQIQRAFGRHDVSAVRAHTGAEAAAANDAMGSHAYARGNAVVFGAAPDLVTAAHEAAHVVQQRRGVSVEGGVGRAGDAYEQHADAVAAAVVRGESAEALLDRGPSGGAHGAAVQHTPLAKTGVKDAAKEAAKDIDVDEMAERGKLAQRRTALRPRIDALSNKSFELLGIVRRQEGRAVNPEIDALDTGIHQLVRDDIALGGQIDSAKPDEVAPRVAELEERVASLEATMKKFDPVLAYHRSLAIDELRVIKKLIEPFESQLQDATLGLDAKQKRVAQLQGALENARLQAQINAAIGLANTAIGLSPFSIISAGITLVTSVENGPTAAGVGSGLTSVATSLLQYGGKAAQAAGSAVNVVGGFMSAYDTLQQAKADRKNVDAKAAQLEAAIRDAQSAAQRVADLSRQAEQALKRAAAIAAKANGAYNNYQSGL